ncbi:TIR domain-containing protein, partial [Nonomuraea sp. RK-328]|nr:TIR domain-containing protein [Nonomuraea sp. RK-328]
MRALRVFLDQASLSANPGLWPSIREALDSSRCFVLLASPEAAASPWPAKEIEHWLAGHSVDDLLLVLTDGTLVWGGDGFDLARSNALPAVLRDAYPQEPRWVDLTWVARRVPGLTETSRVVLSDYAQPEGLTSARLKVQWTLNHAGDRLAETLTPGQYAEREVATGRRILGCDQRAVVTSTGSGEPAYAPGEREPAVPGDDDVLRFLDLRACGTRRTLRTGSGDLAFSPDGALLAGGEPLRLWDAATLEPLGEPLLDTLQGGLRFTTRGSLLAAAPQGTLREWPLTPEALARRACVLAARGLTREEWERYRPPGAQTGRCPA